MNKTLEAKKPDATRCDTERKPERQCNYLQPGTWLLSYPTLWKHHYRMDRIGMKGLKPPCPILCNHSAFMDFKVATAALFPYRSNNVVAIDGFTGRELLLRKVGCISCFYPGDVPEQERCEPVLLPAHTSQPLYPPH